MSATEAAVSSPRRLDDLPRILCERVQRFEDASHPYLRGLIATRVYRDEPDLPAVTKRAEIMARTLERLRPTVLPEERIVGCAYRRFKVHPGVSDPDGWRNSVIYPDRRGFDQSAPIPEEVREELSWWRDNRPELLGRNPARRCHGRLWRYGLATPHGLVQGHTLPDHGILLRAGIGGLRRRIAERLQRADDERERRQLTAMDRCLEGLSAHCRNCARAARQKADQQPEAALSNRLRSVADDCERLAEEPPETFAQALQLLYFSNFADRMDNHGDAGSYGRVDQLLLPFCRRDLAAGRMDEAEAFELVCHMVCKNWSLQSSQNMTLGGLTPGGEDATNPLSLLFLEAMEATGLPTDISVRLHPGSPERLLRTAVRAQRRGFGRPSLYNDEVVVPALVEKGIEPEDARDYAPLGCVEVMIPGRSAFRTMSMGMNLAKVLELTLNRGRCLVTGDRVWDDVPDEFPTFEDLLSEHRDRVRRTAEAGMEVIRGDERVEPEVFPRPWLTVLSRGGIEDARDLTAGQPKYDPVGVTLDGLADVANSLCAVRRLVYEEGRRTLDELRGALRDDWRGHEELRRRVINSLPRFGNDDPKVDALAADEAEHYAACFEGQRTAYGGPFLPMIFGVGTSLLAHKGPKTGASASGRRSGEGLAMSLQPSAAGPRGAMTALLRSAACVDFSRFPGGVSNVQEFDPALVAGREGLDRLVQMVRGFFFELGGEEISLNFVSEERLREAQQHPERHRHLMVRLFGLSARFVRLSPELQQSVIERVSAAGRA